MGAYEAVKDIAKLAQKIDNPELLQRTLEAQQQTLDLQEEVQALRRRVRELEEQERIEGELVFDQGVYWREPDDGERDGPFCQLCWDRDRMTIRLQDYKNGYFGCQSCENTVEHPDATGGGRRARGWQGRG